MTTHVGTLHAVPMPPQGAVDLHVHTAPSIFPRLQSDRELAHEAAAAGMMAVVLKAHEASTVDRARAIDDLALGVRVFGGIVLNHHVGGLNPSAVEVALAFGARIIWMPTLSAQRHRDFFAGHVMAMFGGAPLRDTQSGLQVLDTSGQLHPEVLTILDLMAESNAILSTGHLAWDEAALLATAAVKRGVKRVLVGHPDMLINQMPLDVQIDLARQGVYLEKCYLACSSDLAGVSLAEMADGIRRIGPEACVLATDYGQTHNISPVLALGRFCAELMNAGLSATQVNSMVVENPARLLGL